MKRVLLVAVLLPLSLLGCFLNSIAEDHKIKIGVSVPLRGGAAAYGSDILNGLRFANEELLESRYDLLVEDDNCAAKDAVSVAQKFSSVSKLKYVLGLACSGCVLAAAPVFEKGKIVAISSGAAAPEVSNAGEYIFRTYPSSDAGAELLQKFLASKHGKIGIVSEETDYAQGVLKGLMKSNEGGSLKIVSISYLPSEMDFRTIIERLRAEGVEGVVLNPQSEDRLILLVRQIRESGLNANLYGFIYPSSPAFLSALGPQAEGIIFPDAPSLTEAIGSAGREILGKFTAKYGAPKSAEFYVLSSILAFQALDQSINAGGDARDNLASKEFEGIVGKFKFDPNGDIEKFGYVMKVIRGGKAERM